MTRSALSTSRSQPTAGRTQSGIASDVAGEPLSTRGHDDNGSTGQRASWRDRS